MILWRGAGRVRGRRDGENVISRLYLYQIGRPDTRRRCDEHARAPVDGAATNNPGVVARIVRQIGVLERKMWVNMRYPLHEAQRTDSVRWP